MALRHALVALSAAVLSVIWMPGRDPARAVPLESAGTAAAPITVGAAADSSVSLQRPDTTFGNRHRLRVDRVPRFRTYLRFVVPAVVGPVESAELRLFAVNPSVDGGTAYRVNDNDWREHRITWSSRPALGRATATVGAVLEDRSIEIDLSDLISGPGTYSIALVSPDGDGSAYVSREGAGDRRPELILQRGSDPIVAAASDIACDPSDDHFNHGKGTAGHCRQRATSDLLIQGRFDSVLTMGDSQYETGTLDAFLASYDPTWGRVKSITHPAIGDHEIESEDAAGYFDYFGDAAGDPDLGYYSYDVGDWHLIALNANCTWVGCQSGSPQERWLRSDLADDDASCTLAYWHNPRFSSNGSSTATLDLWRALYDANADVVLNGHFHHYERFTPLGPWGNKDPARGIREFVAGTGGNDLYPFDGRDERSEAQYEGFGVLALALHADSYDWWFVPVGSDLPKDSGHADCH